MYPAKTSSGLGTDRGGAPRRLRVDRAESAAASLAPDVARRGRRRGLHGLGFRDRGRFQVAQLGDDRSSGISVPAGD